MLHLPDTSGRAHGFCVVRRLWVLVIAFAILSMLAAPARAGDATTRYKFSFSPGGTATGYTQVTPQMVYNDATGIGFEPGSKVTAVDGGADPTTGFITSAAPFFFSAKLPEGNYRVTVTLGDPKAESVTTVKAELRRLMLERVHTDAGQFVTRTFVVNIRTPMLADGTQVKLKDREKQSEARAWDDKLTLEFSDQHPAVSSLVIEPAGKVTTVYVIGDSTVCDQPSEPFNSWGQMLTRWFKTNVVVANHAESGETAAGFVGEKRIDKIMMTMTAGDYMIMQFAHNDMKNNSPGALDRYKQLLAQFCVQTRAKGATPIICTAVSRKTFGPDGKIRNSFITSQGDYIAAAREVAADQKVTLIDLNALTGTFYEAVGQADAGKLFAGPNQGTHHDDFGSYEVAKMVVQGIKDSSLPLAADVVDDWKPFDPAHFDPLADFKLPADPGRATQAPLGN
jgi:lysophospholipase L1-like esterase